MSGRNRSISDRRRPHHVRARIRCWRLLLPVVVLTLAGCTGGGAGFGFWSSKDDHPLTEAEVNAVPADYRKDLLPFLESYFSEKPLRDVSISEPALKPMGSVSRYIICVRRDRPGDPPKERVVTYFAGKINQLADATGDQCAGAVYQPVAEPQHANR